MTKRSGVIRKVGRRRDPISGSFRSRNKALTRSTAAFNYAAGSRLLLSRFRRMRLCPILYGSGARRACLARLNHQPILVAAENAVRLESFPVAAPFQSQ